MQKNVKFLVVDSAAFIANAPIHEYAENIYTVENVIREIRDFKTRQRLQFLPYKLNIKEPPAEIFKHVLEFSKKTGDYASLSVTDMKLIALTYQLEKENVGIEHLNKEPESKFITTPSQPKLLSGFCCPKEDEDDIEPPEIEELEAIIEKIEIEDKVNSTETDCQADEQAETLEPHENDNADCVQNSDDESSDDDIEWITTKNILEIQNRMGYVVDKGSSATVACITSDFAMQNMFLQIGLHIISFDGMLVKGINMFILRCYSCFKLTSNVTKIFCPNCGNQTLKKVAVTFNEDGTRNIHINFKRRISKKGKKFSLPRPRGGKFSNNPILCEDQPVPLKRASKMSRKKTDALSPDYGAQSSPFVMNDVYSKSFHLGYKETNSRFKRPIKTGNKKRK